MGKRQTLNKIRVNYFQKGKKNGKLFRMKEPIEDQIRETYKQNSLFRCMTVNPLIRANDVSNSWKEKTCYPKEWAPDRQLTIHSKRDASVEGKLLAM